VEDKPAPPTADEPADVELSVSIFKFNDKTYLIDEQQNVYDFQTHDIIGVFNKHKNDIDRV
jgi:hypothetical protein